jgi:thiamine biosynthesis lipoprotein
MGVEARIVLYAADSTSAVGPARAAFDRIARLDAIMSDYREDSELVRLTERAVGRAVPVSDPLWRVLKTSQELARLSAGAFDVTAGPYIRLWREARRTGRLPAPTDIAEARVHSGWQRLHLDSSGQTARLEIPGMQLDLGGIAKGFAADEALVVLRDHGVTRALVELGGDLVVGDPPPGSRGWEIRLADAAGAPPVVELANAAISTSGDAAQFVEIDGVRHSHVIDPRTGLALKDRVVATVIAPSGTLSDGLSTLAGVLGPDAAPPFLRHHFPTATAYVRRLGAGAP